MATPLTEEKLVPFTIPTMKELDQLAHVLMDAAEPVDNLYQDLHHATGGAAKPLVEFATTPTLEDIGALSVFVLDVRSTVRALTRQLDGIHSMLDNLDEARRGM